MVDRRHAVLGVELERRIDGAERRRRVRLEDVARERPLDEVVVDAEEDVALGIAGRQQRPGDDLACVPALQDPEPEATLLLERPFHGGRDRERVVCHQNDVLRLAASAAACERENRRCRRKADHALATDCYKGGFWLGEARNELVTDRHVTASGRIARSTPRATSTRAVSVAKTFETPRVDPGSSVSSRSG